MLLLAAVCVGSSSSAAPEAAPSLPAPVATLADRPLSQPVVAYRIDARFDATKHTLDATEMLTITTSLASRRTPFHSISI